MVFNFHHLGTNKNAARTHMELTTETTEKYPEFPQYLKIWQNYLYCSVPNSRKKGKPINEGKGEERERKQSLLHSAPRNLR